MGLKLSKRERLILYITAIGIIAVFFDKIVLRQVMSRLNSLNKEIFMQEKILERSLYISSQEEPIAEEYKKYAEDLKQAASDEEEKSKLLSEIGELARKASVFLADIKPAPVKKIGVYKQYTVEIEVESKISFLTDFIYQLEKSPRLLRVRDFRLTPKKKGSSTLMARMTITQVLIAGEKEQTEEGRDG
ncbi:MAG: type 4a pilus biogenesis protein PilO [Candidatus Omnitrophota bacterium]|nr:MAG: type 4a pilus biogenesis protein PilO [Candidatus Omnitrophota bacterium]